MGSRERVIWKFPLETGAFSIELPEGSQVLSVHCQRGEPQMWVLMHTGGAPVRRWFSVVATGQPIDEALGPYIGTFLMAHDALVFHLFEVLR